MRKLFALLAIFGLLTIPITGLAEGHGGGHGLEISGGVMGGTTVLDVQWSTTAIGGSNFCGSFYGNVPGMSGSLTGQAAGSSYSYANAHRWGAIAHTTTSINSSINVINMRP